jgi:Cdc6-like AAA superfamily ATPase
LANTNYEGELGSARAYVLIKKILSPLDRQVSYIPNQGETADADLKHNIMDELAISGRLEELKLLDSSLETFMNNGTCTKVFIQGTPGSGKTKMTNYITAKFSKMDKNNIFWYVYIFMHHHH